MTTYQTRLTIDRAYSTNLIFDSEDIKKTGKTIHELWGIKGPDSRGNPIYNEKLEEVIGRITDEGMCQFGDYQVRATDVIYTVFHPGYNNWTDESFIPSQEFIVPWTDYVKLGRPYALKGEATVNLQSKE